jgi:HlyD family secretion protein
MSRQAMHLPSDFPPVPKIGNRIFVGLFFVLFGFFGAAAWLFLADLSGAVVAVGQVVVENDVKKIQHQTGGIVGEIRVRDGQRVVAGEMLARLDEIIPRTNLAQVVSQLTQLTGRRARLEAERDDRDTLKLPADFLALGVEAESVASGEQRLLKESRTVRVQQVEQLRERVGQFEREIEGLGAQIDAKKRETALIKNELKGVQELYNKQLVSLQRLSQLQRDAARLDGESGVLTANTAKARGQIAEINLQLLSIDQKVKADSIKELREVEAQISQLVEKRIAALDILQRIDIRAPQSGFVHDMKIHTVGGVIAPGEAIMQIVPDSEKLAVELRVSVTDIDQIRIGQKTTLRLSAFNQRTTPEVTGSLTRIAADATREPQTGATYFVARASVDESELKKLKGLVLSPGMPVEAFVETGERSALSYFAKPLTDAFQRSFKEE